MSEFPVLRVKDYRVVFQPYNPENRKKRRFLVSPKRLGVYIGFQNAITCGLRASVMKTDKIRLRFRTFGIIDIYVK